MASFAGQVEAWVNATKARQTAVYRRSVEQLADEMMTTKPVGGRVPFDTGNLARSLLASTEGMPGTSEKVPSGSNVGMITSRLKLGQTVWLGYQAVYARRQNYGFIGADSLGRVYVQPGNYFVEYAIEMWPTIVQLAAEEIKSKVEARIK